MGVSLEDLQTQLRMTNRLLLAILAQRTGRKKQQEWVELLASVGAGAAEIADVLDTTPATVTVTLSRIRKKRNVRRE
jgi:DNA-binding MarR family transcriptional regulator